MASNSLLFASQNKNKQREALELFAQSNVTLFFPQDVPSLKDFDPEEIGTTFENIAENKARAYALKAGMSCIADDSGISVVSLKNFPGIRSNRWFSGDDEAKNQELLKMLAAETNRQAYYTCAVCYYSSENDAAQVFSAELWGNVAMESKGSEGFAYDRIFIPDGYTQTIAELGDAVKQTISPRAKVYKIVLEHI